MKIKNIFTQNTTYNWINKGEILFVDISLKFQGDVIVRI